MPRDRQKVGGERIGKPGERNLTGWRSASWKANEDWDCELFRRPGAGGTCVLYRKGQGGWNGKEGGRWRGTQRPKGPLGPKWGGQLCCFGGRKVGWGGASSAGCRLPLPNTRTKHQAPSTPTPRDTRDPPPGKFQFHFLPIQSHISRTRTTIAPPRGTCHDLIKTPIYQHRPTFYPYGFHPRHFFLCT